MTPESKHTLINALNKIFDEQRHKNYGRDYIEEPSSPEYSMFKSTDETCLLFAVREDQVDPTAEIYSDHSSLESTQRIISPTMNPQN